MIKRGGSTIVPSSFNLPTLINSGSNSSALSYGSFRNLYKQVAVSGSGTETTTYVGGLFERVNPPTGPTQFRSYIAGGNGIAAIHTNRSNGTSDTFYVQLDHLGSPEVFSNSAGVELVRASFGAYGERRDGTDWSGPPSAADLTTLAGITRRGFTGHEHLDTVGLIHMNGRVYDPVAGRFLGADPIVEIGNSQSPNSYAYVWNNPLTLIDPSGFDPEATDTQPPEFPGCVIDIGPGFNCDFGAADLNRWLQWEYKRNVWVLRRIRQAHLGNQWSYRVSSDIADIRDATLRFARSVNDLVTSPEFVDSSAGAGDSLTLGLTRLARWSGDIGSVDPASFSYRVGQVYGIVQSLGLGWGSGAGAVATNVNAARAGTTVFKTAHYASRLEQAGVNVSRAESEVAKAVGAMRPNMAESALVIGRMTVDGVLVEYRAMLLPNGTVNVGSIFPVVP